MLLCVYVSGCMLCVYVSDVAYWSPISIQTAMLNSVYSTYHFVTSQDASFDIRIIERCIFLTQLANELEKLCVEHHLKIPYTILLVIRTLWIWESCVKTTAKPSKWGPKKKATKVLHLCSIRGCVKVQFYV